jgi:hypothetical protein
VLKAENTHQIDLAPWWILMPLKGRRRADIAHCFVLIDPDANSGPTHEYPEESEIKV